MHLLVMSYKTYVHINAINLCEFNRNRIFWTVKPMYEELLNDKFHAEPVSEVLLIQVIMKHYLKAGKKSLIIDNGSRVNETTLNKYGKKKLA